MQPQQGIDHSGGEEENQTYGLQCGEDRQRKSRNLDGAAEQI